MNLEELLKELDEIELIDGPTHLHDWINLLIPNQEYLNWHPYDRAELALRIASLARGSNQYKVKYKSFGTP